MDGLLDWIKTPEGQGLLAAGFGGLANARRGAPLNTIGGAGLAGMQGYAGAQDRQMKIAEEAQMKQLREQQLQQARYANEAANRDQQIRSMAAKFAIPASRSITPIEGATDGVNWNTKETPASFDTAGYVNAVSGIDPMKAIQIQQALVKESNFNKIDVDKFTPQSLAKYSQTRNYGDLVPRDKLEFVEGVGMNPYDKRNEGRAIPNPNKPFSVSPAGDFVPNLPFQDYEKAKAAAGASRTNNVINNGGKAFDVELGKLDAKQLGDWRDAAQTAQNTLGVVQNLRDAEKQGAYSGGGANAKLAAANMLEGFTGIAPKGLVGSQLYNAEASKLVLDHVKTLGANPSNADREFIQKTVPQLNTSAEARAQMANWMEQKAGDAINRYQSADSYARQNQGLGGFGVIKPLLPKPTPPINPMPPKKQSGQGGVTFLGFEK